MHKHQFRKCTFLLLSLSLLAKTGIANSLMDAESMAIAAKVDQLNGAQRIICTGKLRCGSSLTTDFYRQRNFMPFWTLDAKIRPEAHQLLTILTNSYQDGLNPLDYHITQINDLEHKVLLSQNQSLGVDVNVLADLEVTLSDAYLLYSRHMSSGKVNPQASYPDWSVSRNSSSALESYQAAVTTGKLIANLNQLTPSYSGYAKLKKQLALYQQIAADGGWQTIPAGKDVKPGVQDTKRIPLLQKRLTATEGYEPSSEATDKYTPELSTVVKQFQVAHGLKANGIVDKSTLQALNMPVESRIKQIELNMDRLRWLPHNLGNSYIMVNIPNYSLLVVEDNQVALGMPVIVGRGGENKTCVVNSKITSLELNPYWGIPRRIATKEYLTDIQKDPTYLAKHDIRIFNPKTNQEVDSAQIDWETVNQNNFNYFLRQDPGKKNALGKIKFLFTNNCGIYLHDTPSHNLFSKKLRSLSHGCVRVSQPTILANYLLEKDPNWSNKQLESAIETGKHRWVKLATPMDIHIVYQTVWVDDNGHLQFRNDIYKADAIDFPVYLPPPGKD